MTDTRDPHTTTDARSRTEPADLPHESIAESAGTRGEDDRRSEVNPAQNPAPRSPAPDVEAVRKGEDNLDSVKPY